MSARSRLALALMLAALGCDQELRAPLDLDAIAEPTGACVTVIHESLELGLALHEYVADAPSSSGGWALATVLDELNQPELALVRVPATPDEAPTEPISVGPADRIELRAGAVPGELWVLQEADVGTWLRKLAPGIGVVAGNASLDNFPAETGNGDCPTEFQRQLLLLEGRPFVLALPDCSDSTGLELQLLELDPNSLVFTSAWQLSFDPCATDPQCGLYPYELQPIRGGESTHAATAERVAVGFSQVRDYGNGLTSAGVSLLDLRLRADAPNASLITFREVWFTPTELGPVHLGQDLYSVQLHVRNGGSEHDAALLRFDRIGELYIQVKAPQLPLDGRGRLVQLHTQSAMIDVDAGALVAVPLVDVDSWPIWTPTTLLELEDLVDFEPAGVGQLLLRREQAPAQIVHLRCLN
jgi:hypothetical protein